MRMKRTTVALLAGLTLAACSKPSGDQASEAPEGAAAAAVAAPDATGPMFLTAGLWETTASINGAAAAGKNRACIDAAWQQTHDALEQISPAGAGCEKAVRRPALGGFNYEMTCRQEGAVSHVVGEVRGDARHVSVRATATMKMDGEDMPPVKVAMDSKWVGACPAGMKPGDMADDAGQAGGGSGTP